MLTRRTFFASLAALAVGGGAARLRLAEPRTIIGIDYGAGDATAIVTMTNRAGYMWVRDVWHANAYRYTDAELRAKMREVFDRYEPFDAPDFVWPHRDDGDTILELR